MRNSARLLLWHALIIFCLNTSARAEFASILAEVQKSHAMKLELQGRFLATGTDKRAQGRLFQIHPLGLCNRSNRQKLFPENWIAVVALGPRPPHRSPCSALLFKARSAAQRGAKAVLFVRDGGSAAANEALKNSPIPVVLIDADSGQTLFHFLRKGLFRVEGRLRPASQRLVIPMSSANSWKGIVSIFLVFAVFSCLSLAVMIKLHLQHRRRKEEEMTSEVRAAVEQLQRRIFIGQGEESCAVCLELFLTGEELRVLPCRHQFHMACIDPWLISHRTCPLCLSDVLDPGCQRSSPLRLPPASPPSDLVASSARLASSSLLQCRSSSSASSSSSPASSVFASERRCPRPAVSPLTRDDSSYSLKFNFHLNDLGAWLSDFEV